MGGNPTDGQVHLDEAFGVGGGHLDDFRKSVDDWVDDSVEFTETSVDCGESSVDAQEAVRRGSRFRCLGGRLVVGSWSHLTI
jgi:hypothetical protein